MDANLLWNPRTLWGVAGFIVLVFALIERRHMSRANITAALIFGVLEPWLVVAHHELDFYLPPPVFYNTPHYGFVAGICVLAAGFAFALPWARRKDARIDTGMLGWAAAVTFVVGAALQLIAAWWIGWIT